MESRPPQVIERVVNLLIPPVSREYVMGDLSERCSSTWQYCRRAWSTLPLVIFSRARRIWDHELAVSQFGVIKISLLSSAFWASGFVLSSRGLLRIVVPAIVIFAALFIQDIYDDPAKSGLRRTIVEIAFAAVGLLVAQQAVSIPTKWLVFGGGSGCFLALLIRRLCRLSDPHATWRVNFLWLLGLLAVYLNRYPNPIPLLDYTLGVPVILFVYWWHWIGLAGPAEEFKAIDINQRRERNVLERRRDSLQKWSERQIPILALLLMFHTMLCLVTLFETRRQPLNGPWLAASSLMLMLPIYFFPFLKRVNERALRAMEGEIDALKMRSEL